VREQLATDRYITDGIALIRYTAFCGETIPAEEATHEQIVQDPIRVVAVEGWYSGTDCTTCTHALSPANEMGRRLPDP
jgi:hypothetical protein